MTTFSARVTIGGAGRAAEAPLACTVSWDTERLSVVPASGPPITFDLGDIDALSGENLELALQVWGGGQVRIDRLGKVHDRVVCELGDAWRDRLVRCLVLRDLHEIDRFPGHVRVDGPAPIAERLAELRLFESNLVVLPTGAAAFHWRLADLDRVEFDDQQYGWALASGDARLIVSRLAKRTTEFGEKLREATANVSRRASQCLARLFPFLGIDRLERLSATWREGSVVPIATLEGIDGRLVSALMTGAVGPRLRPYVDDLASRSGVAGAHVGFVLRHPDEIDEDATEEVTGESGTDESPIPSDPTFSVAAAADGGADQLVPLFYFLFELPPSAGRQTGLVAWETTSAAGRATYLFEPPDGVTVLNRALLALNFRREPIYLPDDRLAGDPRFARHAIAVRRLPALTALRSAFAGRAIHTSVDRWRRQFSALIDAPR